MRLVIVLALACFGFTEVVLADGPQAAMKRSTNIPAQPLGSALQTLAKDRNFQIVYVYEELQGLNTQGAVGRFSSREALEQLLRGTGLTYKYLDQQTVTIVPLAGGELPVKATASQTSFINDDVQRGSALQIAQLGLRTVDESDARQQGAVQNEGTASAPGKPGEAAIEEIIVTAQKREERLSKVPVSISVLGGRELDSSNALGVSELLSRVPGVATRPSDGGGIIVIRGVAPASATFNSGSTTAYYLDSVPFGFIWSPMLPDSNAYDLERVEVLRGPQGTLYGASALNGVVRVLTREADLRNFDVKARTSVSATEEGGGNYRADLAVNVPIVQDKLAARVVAGYADLSGWIDQVNKKDANHITLNNLRLKVNSQPTERLSIGLSAWRERDPRGSQDVGDENYYHNTALDTETLNQFNTYGLNIGYDFPGFAAKSMTTYLDYDSNGIIDLAPIFRSASPIAYIRKTNSQAFAQEFALTSTTQGLWRWSAGGIYRDQKERLWIDIPGVLPGPFGQLFTSESFAIYGQLTRLFMADRLELSAGLRYFEDRVEVSDYLPRSGIPGDVLVQGQPRKFDAVTPRAVLTWHATPNVMIYGAYSEGFRSGYDQGIDTIRFYPGFPPVEPDQLTNYEIGSKGTWRDGLISFDTSVYYVDWKDVQLNTRFPIPGTNPVIYTAVGLNAASVDGIGVDAAITLRPIQGLELGASVSWNNLESNDLLLSAGLPVLVEGQRLNLSPELTAAASVDYTFPLVQAYRGRLTASANHTAEIIQAAPGNPLPIITKSSNLLIARASFTVIAPSNWELSLFAENINNEDGALFPAAVLGAENTRIRPRTIGMQLEYRFR